MRIFSSMFSALSLFCISRISFKINCSRKRRVTLMMKKKIVPSVVVLPLISAQFWGVDRSFGSPVSIPSVFAFRVRAVRVKILQKQKGKTLSLRATSVACLASPLTWQLHWRWTSGPCALWKTTQLWISLCWVRRVQRVDICGCHLLFLHYCSGNRVPFFALFTALWKLSFCSTPREPIQLSTRNSCLSSWVPSGTSRIRWIRSNFGRRERERARLSLWCCHLQKL